MTPLSELDQARQALRDELAKEQASGTPPDTSWTDHLPSDPLPEDEDDVSVTFIQKTDT